MKFSDILGNAKVVDVLKRTAALRTPFHAYIFEGQEGIGKLFTAKIFAQGLLCVHPNQEEPCQVCSVCKKIENENHGDLHIIVSDGKSIKDSQIEELQKLASKKPFEADRSIFIIDGAHTMTLRAQNRLLKILEEPSGEMVVILLAENIEAITPTILSRCQIMRFEPVERDLIRDYLYREWNCSEENAALTAAFSYGSIGRAIKLLSDEEFRQRRDQSIICANVLLKGEFMHQFSQQLRKNSLKKDDAVEFLEMMEFWFRDKLLAGNGQLEKLIYNQDQMEQLKQGEDSVWKEKREMLRIIDRIEQAKAEIQMNVNISYVLKNMFLEIHQK